jgi:hypothetical protein
MTESYIWIDDRQSLYPLTEFTAVSVRAESPHATANNINSGYDMAKALFLAISAISKLGLNRSHVIAFSCDSSPLATEASDEHSAVHSSLMSSMLSGFEFSSLHIFYASSAASKRSSSRCTWLGSPHFDAYYPSAKQPYLGFNVANTMKWFISEKALCSRSLQAQLLSKGTIARVIPLSKLYSKKRSLSFAASALDTVLYNVFSPEFYVPNLDVYRQSSSLLNYIRESYTTTYSQLSADRKTQGSADADVKSAVGSFEQLLAGNDKGTSLSALDTTPPSHRSSVKTAHRFIRCSSN